MPTRAMRHSVVRKPSATAAEERDQVQQQVEAEARDTRPSRRATAYLPLRSQYAAAAGSAAQHARFATGAIYTIYDIHLRYARRRAIDNAAFTVAMIGILLVFADNEYASSVAAKLMVRSVNLALTVVLLALVAWRFAVERDILVRRNVLPPNVSIFRMPRHVLPLIAELVVCAFCVPPGVYGQFQVREWKYYTDDATLLGGCAAPFVEEGGSCYMAYSYSYEVLGLFALLRLYMLPRVILNLSNFTSYRTSYLGTLHHVDTLSSLFAVKCFLRTHPFKVLAVTFVGNLVLTSYALAIVEAPVNPSLAPLSNALWLVVLTMGTVGYGDLTAVTFAGQILLIFGGMFAGILLFGVLSAAVFGFLTLNERDHRFLYLLRRQEHNKRLKDAAARSIQAAWKYAYARAPGVHAQSRPHSKLQDKLFARLSTQRDLRKQTVEEYKSVTTELLRCQDQLLFSLREEHSSTMKRLLQVEKRLDTLTLAAENALATAD